MTINVGDTVVFSNAGGYHNVNGTLATYPNNPESFGYAMSSWSSMVGNPTSSWTYTYIFTIPGSYTYQCDPHVGMGMVGTIIVNSTSVPGCTDPLASNYNSLATVDDGSCLYNTSYAVDLFISEYAEGSGYNKYIEIYNGTGQSVDLSNYEIWKITNGGSWPEYSLSLSGTLAHNDVFIVCHSSSSVNPSISGVADITWSQASWTGDDAVGLAKNNPTLGSSFVLIDVIGEDGSDPGNGWDVAGTSDATKDHTLIRKCNISQGNTNWALSAGTNPQDSEWEVYPQNHWLNINQHTFPCQVTAIYGCTDSTALNFDPNANSDDGSCLYPVLGCMDSSAYNYDSLATIDNGLCCFVTGCTNNLAYNFDSTACYDDGSCVLPIFGCMDINAMNYNSLANASDSSCVFLSDKVDLFFSEYGEGSSNNKWLEIYNSTGQNIDLSNYALARVSNAPTTTGVYEYWVDFPAGSQILAGDVFVVAHPSSSNPTPPFGPGNSADWFYSALSNGDDGFALVYGAEPSTPSLPGVEYIILDHIGDFNGDPGSGWSVAGISNATKDHTLIRKCNISQGNSDWLSSAGTDSLNSEWIVLPQDDWSDIGQHSLCSLCDIIADFINTNSVCSGDVTSFINTSTSSYSILTYFWDFGDGNTSTLENPTHIYSSSGTYVVSLVVTDTNGCSDTIQNTTNVLDNPTVYFSYPNSSNVGLTTLTFDNLSNPQNGDDTTTMLFSWFIDGQLISNTSNFTYTFAPISGDTTCYTVQLVGINQYGCIDSVVTSICVFPINNSIVYGCTDSTAINYFPGANVDDGSCCYVYGCTDITAMNYNANACIDDGSCAYSNNCLNPNSNRYTCNRYYSY